MAVKEVERKITKIGNSLGVTFPQEVLEHLKVKQGESVVFQISGDGEVTFRKRPAVNVAGFEDIDEEFLEGMKEMFHQYDNTLRNLVNR